ncbi:MAG: glycosyltransferase family 4 protein [Pseudomonadales bacterium]|nr:glycosyltransferase family 4 protein [Pseudomonadales bacterium]
MNKIIIITPEISSDKGGIQNWMFYVEKLLKTKNRDVSYYAYKEDRFRKLFSILKGQVYILATWKMAVFIFPIIYLIPKKVIIFVHGNEVLKLNLLQRTLLKYLIKRRNTRFIANSEAIGTLFEKNTGRKVDLVQFPFMEIPKDIQFQDNNNLEVPLEFFTITRLVKRKNIENVIRAMALIKNNIPDLNFLYKVAGSGSEFENLNSLVDNLKLANCVSFVGRVTNEQKEKLYLEADYFLLPSIYDEANASIEGYGIVYIEANSYGVPVLSGDTGGMIEAVNDGVTGLHCNGSVADIYEKIMKLVEMKFDKSLLVLHAKQHDYLTQNRFIDFLESFNE